MRLLGHLEEVGQDPHFGRVLLNLANNNVVRAERGLDIFWVSLRPGPAEDLRVPDDLNLSGSGGYQLHRQRVGESTGGGVERCLARLIVEDADRNNRQPRAEGVGKPEPKPAEAQ